MAFPQLRRQPLQAVREPFIDRPVTGDVASLPAVVHLHDGETERSEVTRRHRGVGQDLLFADLQPVGVPGTPQRNGSGAGRLGREAGQGGAEGLELLVSRAPTVETKPVQLDGRPRRELAVQESRHGAQPGSATTRQKLGGQFRRSRIRPDVSHGQGHTGIRVEPGQYAAGRVLLRRRRGPGSLRGKGKHGGLRQIGTHQRRRGTSG